MAKDTAPWVWQATGLFDRMNDRLLTIVELAADLQDEYERGKMHGDDDRKLIEQQNREQAREIDRLKNELSKMKVDAAIRTKARQGGYG